MRKHWETQASAQRDPDNPHDYKGSYGLAVGAVDACDDIIAVLESTTIQEQERHEHDWYNDGAVLRCYDCTDTQEAE